MRAARKPWRPFQYPRELDLAQRFGRPGGDTTKKSCIVMEALVKETAQVFGVVVDAVSEVLEIPDSEIEAPPAFGGAVRTDFIYGMGKVQDRFVVDRLSQTMPPLMEIT